MMKKTILYKGGLIALLALLVAAPGLSAAQTKMTEKEMKQKVEAGTATPSELLKIVTNTMPWVRPETLTISSWDGTLQQKLLNALDQALNEGKFSLEENVEIQKTLKRYKDNLERSYTKSPISEGLNRIIQKLDDKIIKQKKQEREAKQKVKPLNLEKLLGLLQSDKPTALEELKTALKSDAAAQIFQNKNNSDTIIQAILDKYADGTQDTEPAIAKIKALREAGFGRPELTKAMETVIDKTVKPGEELVSLNRSISDFADSIGKAEPKGFWGKVWTNITHFWQRRSQDVDGKSFKEGLKDAIETGSANTVKDYIQEVARSGTVTSTIGRVKIEDRTVLMADVIEAASKSGKYSADNIESFIRKAIAPEGVISTDFAGLEEQALKLYAEIGNNEAIKTALKGKDISEVIQNFLKEHKIKQALAGSKQYQEELKRFDALATLTFDDSDTPSEELVTAIQRLSESSNYSKLSPDQRKAVADGIEKRITSPEASPELRAEGIRFLIDKEIAPSKSMKGKTVREIRVATNKTLEEINRLIEEVFKPALKGITDPKQRKTLKEAFGEALGEKISAIKKEYETYYDSDSEQHHPEPRNRKNKELNDLISKLESARTTFDNAADNPDSDGDAGGLFGSGKTQTLAQQKRAAKEAEKKTKAEAAEAAKDGQGDSNSGETEVTGVQTDGQHEAHSGQGSDGGGTTGDQRTPKQQKSDSSNLTPKERRALQKEEKRKAAREAAEELAKQLKEENGGDDPQPVEDGE